VKFFNTLYNQVGTKILKFLSNSDEKVLKTLQSDFINIQPTLIQPEPNFMGMALIMFDKHGLQLEDHFPKVNIWQSFSNEEITALSDQNWINKKTVIDKINNLIISSDYKIASDNIEKLLDVLLKQLNVESNKQSKKY
jgi:hypothetical protein